MSGPIWALVLMLGWHALADYPLQGDFLAKAKNRAASIPGVPWYQALGAHAAIHAVGVAVITGSLWIGLAELACHALIDDLKCTGKLTFNQDQSAHVACKIVWAGLMGAGIAG